ncbi:MAG TPA: VanZ family protein [Acidobacteriaceae bacterium]
MSSSAPAMTQVAGGKRRRRFYLSVWLPVVFMIGCIALESQPFFGADHTAGPLRQLVEWLTGPMADPQWDHVHFLIRKCGHFTGYGLLSFTWFRAFWKSYRPKPAGFENSYTARKLKAHLLAMLGTFAVASADEFHQSFLPNRTGTPVDVLIDCIGALVAQIVIFLVMLRFFRDSR